MKDHIVEEVRKYRMEHTQKFGGDLSAICADLRSIQYASGHKVVRLPPKRLRPTTGVRPKRQGARLMPAVGRDTMSRKLLYLKEIF